MRKAPALTPVSYAFTLGVSLVADALFVWPLHVVLAAGQNAILSMLMTALWAIFIILLPPRSHSSKWTSRVWQILNAAGGILLSTIDSIMLASLVAMLRTFYFFNTPAWAFLISFALLVAWGSSQAPEAVPRVIMLWGPLLITISVSIMILALHNVQYPRAIWPNHVISLDTVFSGVLMMAYILTPIGLTIRWLASPQNTVPVPKIRILGLFLGGGFLVAMYCITIGTLGPSALIHVRWPIVFVMNEITVDSAFFVSRVGIAVIFGWLTIMALGFLVHARILVDGLVNTLSLPSLRFFGSYCVTGLWVAIAWFLPSPIRADSLLLKIVNPATWGYLLVEMAMLLLTFAIDHHHRSSA